MLLIWTRRLGMFLQVENTRNRPRSSSSTPLVAFETMTSRCVGDGDKRKTFLSSRGICGIKRSERRFSIFLFTGIYSGGGRGITSIQLWQLDYWKTLCSRSIPAPSVHDDVIWFIARSIMTHQSTRTRRPRSTPSGVSAIDNEIRLEQNVQLVVSSRPNVRRVMFPFKRMCMDRRY